MLPLHWNGGQFASTMRIKKRSSNRCNALSGDITLWSRPLQAHVPEHHRQGRRCTSGSPSRLQHGTGVNDTVNQGKEVGFSALKWDESRAHIYLKVHHKVIKLREPLVWQLAGHASGLHLPVPKALKPYRIATQPY